MRTFIAINFPLTYKKQWAKIADFLNLTLNQAARIKSENYHLTLRFYGEQKKQGLKIAQDSLNKLALEFKPFFLYFKNVALFPRTRRPRYVVINIEKNITLEKIAKYLGEKRTLKPHITLYRLKKNNNQSLQEKIKKINFNSNRFLVRNIDLMSSQLDCNGSVYRVEKKYYLQNHENDIADH